MKVIGEETSTSEEILHVRRCYMRCWQVCGRHVQEPLTNTEGAAQRMEISNYSAKTIVQRESFANTGARQTYNAAEGD